MSVKVTIATITYNSAKFVRQTIESVLAQSFADFEYLISDDCSSDGTWEIIQEYSDSRIRAWQNETNLREYPNRNKTLAEARGEFIIWIDGDDILYPHGLEFMVKMLVAFPNSAMACARPYWQNMVYPYELRPEETYRFDYLGSPVTINGFPDTLIKTAVLKRLGGLPTNYISGDTFIKKKIAMYNNILLMSNGVSWWRMPKDQASSKVRGTLFGMKENLAINTEFLSHKDCPLSDSEKALAKSNLYSAYYRNLIKLYLIKFKFLKFWKNWNSYEHSFTDKLTYIVSPLNFKYQNKFTADNPLIDRFSKNPYASNKNKTSN